MYCLTLADVNVAHENLSLSSKMYCLTLADAADDRLVFGSDLGAGYPYTDLVYGVPDMNGQLLYAGLFQPENISTRKL
jgi:hypothetical protein